MYPDYKLHVCVEIRHISAGTYPNMNTKLPFLQNIKDPRWKSQPSDLTRRPVMKASPLLNSLKV